MGKLTEKYVQDAAINYLKNYYEAKTSQDCIFARKEVSTYYKKTKGRADGLLAFNIRNNDIYTVSMEAKSHKTFNSLCTLYENNWYFGIGFIFLIITYILFHLVFNSNGMFLKWVFPGLLSVILTFILLLIFQYLALFEKHGIIEQIRRYPANEKWIAISKDAFKFFNKLNDNELIFRAKKYGIGILVISSKLKIEVFLDSKEDKSTKHTDFLKYYIKGEKIRESLIINRK